MNRLQSVIQRTGSAFALRTVLQARSLPLTISLLWHRHRHTVASSKPRMHRGRIQSCNISRCTKAHQILSKRVTSHHSESTLCKAPTPTLPARCILFLAIAAANSAYEGPNCNSPAYPGAAAQASYCCQTWFLVGMKREDRGGVEAIEVGRGGSYEGERAAPRREAALGLGAPKLKNTSVQDRGAT